jgi:hypothetical protein
MITPTLKMDEIYSSAWRSQSQLTKLLHYLILFIWDLVNNRTLTSLRVMATTLCWYMADPVTTKSGIFLSFSEVQFMYVVAASVSFAQYQKWGNNFAQNFHCNWLKNPTCTGGGNALAFQYDPKAKYQGLQQTRKEWMSNYADKVKVKLSLCLTN